MTTLEFSRPYDICVCTREITKDQSKGTTVFSIIGALDMIIVGNKYYSQQRKGYGICLFKMDRSLIGIISYGLHINHFDKLSDVREEKLNKLLD